MFVACSVQGSGVRGGVGQLTRRWPTPDGLILRATTPEGVSPIIGPGTLPLQTPGPPATVTPGRLLVSPVSPHKGRTNWLLSPFATTLRLAAGGGGGGGGTDD